MRAVKTEILKAIKEEAGFVSGQELCDRFGVSRTAVWKAIGQLKEEGFQIEAVRNKGYRLLSSDDVITEAELMSSMEGGFIKKIVYYEETDSPIFAPESWRRKAPRTGPWWSRTFRTQGGAGGAGCGYLLPGRAFS